MQSVAPLVIYLFVVAISILDGFAAPVSYVIVPAMRPIWARLTPALSMTGEAVQLVGLGLGGLFFATNWSVAYHVYHFNLVYHF